MMYCAVLMGLTACNENSIFEGELYKKVVYVLSETDLTFPVTHSLNTPVWIQFFRVLILIQVKVIMIILINQVRIFFQRYGHVLE